jgi:hypothetical protein
VTQQPPRTIFLSPPACALPAEPQKLGPSGGKEERDDGGRETGNAIVPLAWFIRVYQVSDEERAWREAAKACLEAAKAQ